MKRPLQGLKVIDLTRALAGPYGTMSLADLGADVIKVEPTPSGDMSRSWGPFDGDTSTYYLSANRNKRGIGLNFRSEDGLRVLKDLILKSDLVIENFKTGTMESMGLDYPSLAAIQPRLIMASVTGFGNTGPAKDWPGFDQIAQGYSGLMSVTGMPDGEPTRVGVAIGDMIAGLWITIGVLSAVVERQSTGKGQHVQTSLLSSLISILSVQGQRYLSLNDEPKRVGNAHPVIFPYGSFMASDGPMNVAPATTAMWEKVCDVLSLGHLVADERFLTNADRVMRRDELQKEFDKAMNTKTRLEWTELMLAQGIPAGPINSVADALNDKQVQALQLVESINYPTLGNVKHVGLPLSMESIPKGGSVHSPAPEFGQHTWEVMQEFGWSDKDIIELIASKAIHQRN